MCVAVTNPTVQPVSWSQCNIIHANNTTKSYRLKEKLKSSEIVKELEFCSLPEVVI